MHKALVKVTGFERYFTLASQRYGHAMDTQAIRMPHSKATAAIGIRQPGGPTSLQ